MDTKEALHSRFNPRNDQIPPVRVKGFTRAKLASRHRCFRFDRIQRHVREDVERTAIRSAKYQINGPLRNVDSSDELPFRAVHQDLFRPQVHVAVLVLRYGLSAVFGKECRTAKRSVGGDVNLEGLLI